MPQYDTPRKQRVLKKVLRLKLAGKSLKEIAEELGVCYRTAINYSNYIEDHGEDFYGEDIEYYRDLVWEELTKILREGDLTKWQRAKILRDLVRSVEPIRSKIERKETGKIFVVEKPFSAKDEQKHEGD